MLITRLKRGFSAILVAAVAFPLIITSAQTLEWAGNIIVNQSTNRATTDCFLAVWNNPDNGRVGLQELVATGTRPTTGGAWWRGSTPRSAAPMDENALQRICNVTNVNIIRNVGTSGNFLSQSYLGIEFTATAGDG